MRPSPRASRLPVAAGDRRGTPTVPEGHQILAAKVANCPQQIMPLMQPCFMLGDNRSAIAVLPDLERGAPFAAPTDGDGVRRRSDCMLVQDLAHPQIPWLEPLTCEQRRPFGWHCVSACHRSTRPLPMRRGTAQPFTCGVTRYDGTTLPGTLGTASIGPFVPRAWEAGRASSHPPTAHCRPRQKLLTDRASTHGAMKRCMAACSAQGVHCRCRDRPSRNCWSIRRRTYPLRTLRIKGWSSRQRLSARGGSGIGKGSWRISVTGQPSDSPDRQTRYGDSLQAVALDRGEKCAERVSCARPGNRYASAWCMFWRKAVDMERAICADMLAMPLNCTTK